MNEKRGNMKKVKQENEGNDQLNLAYDI